MGILAVSLNVRNNMVYLTRRNLLALLAKLDRNRIVAGDSQCTLVKQDTTHKKYPCTTVTHVVALEDAEYYDRPSGEVYPADVPAVIADDTCRAVFEQHILQEIADGHLRKNAWPVFERANSGCGKHGDGKGTILDGYLDLYLSHRWATWKACWHYTQDTE